MQTTPIIWIPVNAKITWGIYSDTVNYTNWLANIATWDQAAFYEGVGGVEETIAFFGLALHALFPGEIYFKLVLYHLKAQSSLLMGRF